MYLVPARGGSRRLPGKNLKKFGGLPLVVRAMFRAKLTADLVGGDSRVVVSTDSEAIASAVQVYDRFEIGGLLMRPAELATDEATSEQVAIHAIETLGNVDTVVLIQPTSPLVMAEHIAGIVRAYLHDGWPRKLCAEGSSVPCGAGYVTSAAYLLRGGLFCDGLPVPIPRYQSYDIDTQLDWDSAAALYEEMQYQQPAWHERYGVKGAR